MSVSQSEGATSTSPLNNNGRSSTSGRLTTSASASVPSHAPRLWQPSHLRRSGSLTALEYDGSVHSLPQLPINENGKEGVYPARTSKRTQSEERTGNTNTSGREGRFPSSTPMSNVRQGKYEVALILWCMLMGFL